MKNKTLLLTLLLIFIITLFAAGCGKTQNPPVAQPEVKELIVYSGRKEALIKPVIEQFEKQTGIKVVLRTGGASELANAIMEEKNNPKGDVFIANDGGTLEKLKMEQVLLPYKPADFEKVPADFKSPDGSWIGLSVRARVIMYNTNLLSEKDVPKSVLELTDKKWQGQVAIASSANESLIGHVTVLRKTIGDAATEKFLKGLMDNKVQVLKGHTEVRKAVGAGEFKLGLINHYYYHLQKKEGSPVAAIYPDQGQDQMGTATNIAGAAIIKGAKNIDNAKKFMDFLLKPEVQKLFAELNYEIPVVEGVPVFEAKSLKEFKRAAVNMEVLGQELNNTMNMLEKIGMP